MSMQALGRALRTRMSDSWQLFTAEYAQLPAISIWIVKPKTHVFRAWCFATYFVTGILNISTDALQVLERFA